MTRAESHLNSRFIRYRKAPPANRRARSKPGLPRIGRNSLRLSVRRGSADDRLRQDHAGLPDGCGYREPPAIVLSGGPMVDGYYKGKLSGSGMALWEARRKLAAGEIDEGN